jgi:hypothetical protein
MSAFENPWPDREAIYREHDLDRELFPDSPELHPCTPRYKLRVHDIVTWLDALAGGERPLAPAQVDCPPSTCRITPRRPLEPAAGGTR